MVTTDQTKAAKTAAALAALAAAATLAGCHEKPYPTPAHETYVRTTTTTELAGPSYAPPPDAYYPAPSSTVTESYSSTTSAQNSLPVYPLPPIQPERPYSRGSSSIVYDLGPVMGHHRRVHSRLGAPVAPVRRVRHASSSYVASARPMAHPAPAHREPPVAARPPSAIDTARTGIGNVSSAAAAAASAAAAKASEAAMAAKDAVGTAEVRNTTTTTTTSKTAASPAGNTTGAGDRTTRLAALQTALTAVVASKAVLATPDKMAPNQPVDVSLTLPADFSDTVRKEAEKQGLADAAASANMTALLAGDGYAVTPAETQSQPLTVGQPTEFHWTVTAQPNARGALHADIGADLLGGGSDTLNLGTVQKGGALGVKLTPKMLGAGILALIVILVLGWLARGRSTPSRSASGRRASRRARDYGPSYGDRSADDPDRL